MCVSVVREAREVFPDTGIVELSLVCQPSLSVLRLSSKAVVNFTSPKACQSCFQTLAQAKGKSNMMISDFKQAERQGLSENLALFLSKAMNLKSFDSQSKPHVFSSGTETEIPLSLACAKLLKPPEMVQLPEVLETKPSFEVPPGLHSSHSSVKPQFRARDSGICIGEDLLDCVHVGISAASQARQSL